MDSDGDTIKIRKYKQSDFEQVSEKNCIWFNCS